MLKKEKFHNTDQPLDSINLATTTSNQIFQADQNHKRKRGRLKCQGHTASHEKWLDPSFEVRI